MKKFLICTPSYSENNGGAIALHKLCHLLNKNEYEAYLYPITENIQLNSLNYKDVLPEFLIKQLKKPFKRLRINKTFNTPVLYKVPDGVKTGEYVVVYPEITFGNPLQAKHVVRWLLHNPGHDTATGRETKEYFFGKNEIYFRYGTYFKDFKNIGSKTSRHILTVSHVPLEIFLQEKTNVERTGTAYCIRKGVTKPIVHDTSNSINIDRMKQAEIAKVFKKVKTFISYDSYTFFSRLAAISGCDSIVIPEKDIDIENWLPNIEDRYGLSYGFDNLEWARQTHSLLMKEIYESESKSQLNTIKFARIVNRYFK